ncbi:MAG TPA: glycolate oxidase subunit GlcE [Acidisphaera sp.]|nr:glycolate oxidase subunit GlcE [Acidisphaera sp.]
MEGYRAATAKDVAEVVTAALAGAQPLEILGGGSKRGIGRPLQVETVLDVSGLSGIIDYEPAELVLTARAGTPLAEIEAALHARGQMLAFEPPDWRGLLGTDASAPTLGGTIACNLAGPRRIKSGAARDHFLGFEAVNGRGEIFRAGGKVVKNVTGYDLCKLFAGAYGTLGVLTELSVKVLPRPETVRTVLLRVAEGVAWQPVLAECLNSPHEVSGAAYLPGAVAGRSRVAAVAGSGGGIAAVRVEGHTPSATYRADAITPIVAAHGETEQLGAEDSAVLWREIGDAALLAEPAAHAVWRISLTPSAGPAFAEAVGNQAACDALFDWGGGLVWLAIGAESGDAGAAVVREALGAQGGGHATLMRAADAVRASVAVFEPLAGPLAALTARVKESFDPLRVLNPGRMYAGV